MNYRHAFHAGNHTEVFKHAALTLVLERLLEKPQPFAVLDTHAGLGLYDLTSEEAQKTKEYEEGVGRIVGRGLDAAPAYAALIEEMNPSGLVRYPGSPEIVRRLLRADDRLMACELHPADAPVLRALSRGDGRVAVHHRDGYEAMGALLPPTQRRGLVLIDPPFEKTDEAARMVRSISAALRRWSNGVYMAWYPIKDARIGAALAHAATATPWPKALRVAFSPYALGEASLPGSGLIVVNTPWTFEDKLRVLCSELAGLLGNGRGDWSVERLTST